MNALILFALAALTWLSVALLKVYMRVPEHELKRRARAGDEVAQGLVQAAVYGPSLEAVLWTVAGLSASLAVFVAASFMPNWLAVLTGALLVWSAFVWQPARESRQAAKRIGVYLAKPLAALLRYVHVPLMKIAGTMAKYTPVRVHTGLYTKEDLLEMLEFQSVQADNRMSPLELEVARHALTFGDQTVANVMMPRRAVKMVSSDEVVGPVLMSELHKSGFSRFPVYSGTQDTIVGTLFLRDLMRAKSGGKISKIMHTEVMYVHENQSLADALQAILKTNHHLYVVVNEFEEFVGIITMEDVLERIVGRPIIDEFDAYDDRRAVAARAALEEHQERITAGAEATSQQSEEPIDESTLEAPGQPAPSTTSKK